MGCTPAPRPRALLNEDAFQKAGLTSAPQTWEETASDMQALKKAGYDCPMAIEIDADDVWQLMEQFSAVHGIPVATLNDGYDESRRASCSIRVCSPNE